MFCVCVHVRAHVFCMRASVHVCVLCVFCVCAHVFCVCSARVCACVHVCSGCVHVCWVCSGCVCACSACVLHVCAHTCSGCACMFCVCVRACVHASKCLLLSRSFKAFPELCSLPRCVRRRQPAVGREGGEEGPSLPCTNTRSLFASLMPCPWGVSLGCGAKEGTEFSKLLQHQIDRNSRR